MATLNGSATGVGDDALAYGWSQSPNFPPAIFTDRTSPTIAAPLAGLDATLTLWRLCIDPFLDRK